MDSHMDEIDSSNNQATKKKFVITWPIAIGIVALAIFSCCGTGMLLLSNGIINPFPHTDFDHSEFSTNQERLDFINQTLPIDLPPSTKVSNFHVFGFQDWVIDFEGQIPITEIDAFIQSLPPLDQIGPDQFEGNILNEWIEIRIDRTTGDITIHWFDT